MVWLSSALIYALALAAVNHIDKHLLSRYFRGGGPGSLAIFSSLVAIPFVALLLVFGTPIFPERGTDAAILILNGMIYMASLLPYFFALQKDDASIVAPLFQLISPISYVLGVLFLGEKLQSIALVGGAIITLCAVGLTLEIKSRRSVRLKKEVFNLMVVSSMLTAANGTFFKKVATDIPFWQAAFWEYIGVASFGILLLCFVSSFRHEFFALLRQNHLRILSLNGVNEVLAVTAKVVLHFGTLFAPVAYVFWVAEGFQPVFVLLFGILLSTYFPKLYREKRNSTVLLQKTAAIIGMLFGTLLLAA